MVTKQQPAYESLAALRDRAKEEVSKVVVGQNRAVELLLVAAIARGHVLIEGPPGSAKTLLGADAWHTFSVASSSAFNSRPIRSRAMSRVATSSTARQRVRVHARSRVHGAPVGGRDQSRPGQDAGVTARGDARSQRHHRWHDAPAARALLRDRDAEPLSRSQGTYPLPEAQLDRFLFKIELDYCDAASEVAMLNLPHLGIAPDMLGEIQPLLGTVGLDKARDELDSTLVPDEVARYVVAVVRATRASAGVELGRELAGRDPPARGGEGQRTPLWTRRGLCRGRAGGCAACAAAPPDHRR